MIFFLPFSFPRTNVLFPGQHLSPFSVGHYTFQPFLHLGCFFLTHEAWNVSKVFRKYQKPGAFGWRWTRRSGCFNGHGTGQGHGIFPVECQHWLRLLETPIFCPFSILRNLFKEVINSIKKTGGFEHLFVVHPDESKLTKIFSFFGVQNHTWIFNEYS